MRVEGLEEPEITGALQLKAHRPTATAIDLQMSSRRLINGGANESSGRAQVKK